MAGRIWLNVFLLIFVTFAHDVRAQDLTPAGKAVLQGALLVDRVALDNPSGPIEPAVFPLATCVFPGGLCGAVNRDGTVAVSPRYDWVGTFSDHRAAVRLGGLYGFIDEEGREVVLPQYRIVDDYKFGFAQVDVNGKSGLIDRDGKMVIEPKYGFVEAISPDRFRVSEGRRLGGSVGAEDFSGHGATVWNVPTGVVDLSGQWIEPLVMPSLDFDRDDPSIRWVQRGKLWGLSRADGSWLVEPKFEQVGLLRDGLARAMIGGKVGFIDRTGNFAIEPVFDEAWWFTKGVGRTSVKRDGIVGVIDKTGAWVFRTNYQQVRLAIALASNDRHVFGWHFKKAGLWGLLDLDGRVVLDADFDQTIQYCDDGRLHAYKNKELLYFKEDGSPPPPSDSQRIDASCGAVAPYMVKIGDKLGLVDAESHSITPVQFDAIVWAGRRARNVKIGGKWGRIDLDGRWLLEPSFDYLSTDADILVASIDGKRGLMRSDGSWLIEPKFDAAARRRDYTAFVTVAGTTGVLRLMDQSWVVPPRPGVLCDINGAIMSQLDGKRAILSPTGETWIDIDAERIGIRLDFGLLTFLKNGKWGLVDTGGKVMVEPQFDEPVYFTSNLRGIAWAKRDGNWCAIDRRGSPVAGIPCTDTNPVPSLGGRFECKVEP